MQTSANDRIQIATIGFGGMGQGDTKFATSLPGVQLVAVADVYDGRLAHAREVYGDGVFTTRDHREVLNRKDVDAVIVATPDHWHAPITIAALEAGKSVYCEKPMVQKIAEGAGVVSAQERTGKTLQIGSQYASSHVFLKARDLLKEGVIGELNLVEAWLDRNTALGAWQYSIPTDATPVTVDWDRFLGSAPKRPFEPIRLFRWRNYDDYGTGVAGDLFVHLLTGLHVVTGALGPQQIYTCGGLRFWKDGRDVPDVMLGLMDYPQTERHPAFTFSLKVNFAAGGPAESFGVKFVGSEGTMTATMAGLSVSRTPRPADFDYSIDAHSKEQRQVLTQQQMAKIKAADPRTATADAMESRGEMKYVPHNHSAHLEHHRTFYTAVRAGKKPFEDAVFGLRAAGPALLANRSYAEGKPLRWDAQAMKAL